MTRPSRAKMKESIARDRWRAWVLELAMFDLVSQALALDEQIEGERRRRAAEVADLRAAGRVFVEPPLREDDA